MVHAKMESFDITRAVQILTSNDSMLQPSAETLAKLKGKHPPKHPDSNQIPDPTDENSDFTTNREGFLKALHSFKKGCAGGPDGLTHQHLLDMTEEAMGEEKILSGT